MPTPYSYLNYARGNVSSFTTGIVDNMQPMQLSTGVYWKSNASFTDHFLKPSKHLIDGPEFKRVKSTTWVKAFHHWEGGIPASKPIVCYNYEQCTTTAIWDGKVWTSKTS
ncbi:hypothetical protein DSO57_1016659 [Entomophthora muscae]|uniref:Uncharacterized protein n=1 Tax=Entomophthora muscae TaxID=34485 RepID=A0ACC2TFM0_9FUNG|nr:hypothetical protein DSO57_1016659 [Entomophthora muscae]